MIQLDSPGLVVVGLVAMMLALPLGGAILQRTSPHEGVSSPRRSALSAAVPLAVSALLGLSAYILNPIVPLLVIFGSAKLFPLEHRQRSGFLAVGCLFIVLGTALAYSGLPLSPIATTRLQGFP
jgi:predicted cation transporter